MTIVGITTTNQVLITETSVQTIELLVPTAPVFTEVFTAGPQGPIGPQGLQGPQGPQGSSLTSIGLIPDVNIVDRVSGSVLYYDEASSVFRADSIVTSQSLTDGGNF